MQCDQLLASSDQLLYTDRVPLCYQQTGGDMETIMQEDKMFHVATQYTQA